MFFESDLLEHEVERYSRQIVVPGIHVDGQKKLRNAKVVVVGCGGLGAPVIMYLSSCGIGTIGLVDFDRVESHNLQRQVIYAEQDIGEWKVVAAARAAERMNSNVNIIAHNVFLDKSNVESILELYGIVLDCTDSITTRYLINDHCRLTKKSLICGSVLRWEGQLYKITPDGPCYRCMFPVVKDNTVSCEDGGVVGPICGVIGSLQASEAIRTILGNGEPKVVIYNGATGRLTNIEPRNPRKSCSACNGNAAEDLVHRVRCSSEAAGSEPEDDEMAWEDVLMEFDSYYFVDVRPAVQYGMCRVRGSRNIPLDTIYQEIESVGAVRKKIGVLCKRGITAREGVRLLRDHGIASFSVKGGIDGLRRHLSSGGGKAFE